MSKKLTKEEIISRFKEVHGDKYDYSEVEYINYDMPMKIICPHHGPSWQRVDDHLSGIGCKKCALKKFKNDILHKKIRELPKEIVLPPNSRAIPTGNNKYTIVDEDMYDELIQYNWHGGMSIEDKTGGDYVSRAIGPAKKRTQISMHRYLMGQYSDSETKFVDHINGIKADNRRCNLRLCTARENSRNTPNYTGKYKGVSFRKSRNSWKVSITYGGKVCYIGSSKSEEEAARMYDAAAVKYHGEFAWLNFPEEHGFPPREKEL